MRMKLPKKIECPDCEVGVQMCKHFPCFGTVRDIKRIIKHGYGDRLMMIFREQQRKEIALLLPAIKTFECGSPQPLLINLMSDRPCTFLKNGKCMIHDIKPTMGKICCCKKGVMKKENRMVVGTWNSVEGKNLIEKWRKEYFIYKLY